MGKYTLKYIGLCMGIYLALSGIEIFLLRPLIDFIGTEFVTHLIVYNVLLLIVNPLVVYIVAGKLIKFNDAQETMDYSKDGE